MLISNLSQNIYQYMQFRLPGETGNIGHISLENPNSEQFFKFSDFCGDIFDISHSCMKAKVKLKLVWKRCLGSCVFKRYWWLLVYFRPRGQLNIRIDSNQSWIICFIRLTYYWLSKPVWVELWRFFFEFSLRWCFDSFQLLTHCCCDFGKIHRVNSS